MCSHLTVNGTMYCSEIQMALAEKEKGTVVKQHLLLDFAVIIF